MISGSKKGNIVLFGFVFIVFIFVLGLSTIIGNKLFDEMNDNLQSDSEVSELAKETSSDLYNKYPTLFDNVYLTFFVFAWIAVIIASFAVQKNPVWLIVAIFFLAAVLYVGMNLINVYEEFADQTDYSDYKDNFPKTNFINENIVAVILMILFSGLIVVFGKGSAS